MIFKKNKRKENHDLNNIIGKLKLKLDIISIDMGKSKSETMISQIEILMNELKNKLS